MSDHWFEPMADHLGSAYLRYSFTRGTRQEVDFLCEVLAIEPGVRVLDVGCGPGRHAHELASRGIEVHGIDISRRFVDLAVRDAPLGATFERMDARGLTFEDEFDVAISLCQGAFGLGPLDEPGADEQVLGGMVRALRGGGRVAVSAFSSYFRVRYADESHTFDPATGINHETTTVKDESGADADFDMWTWCYTPRELRYLADRVGLTVDGIHSVSPGDYAPHRPDLERYEFLLLAHT